MKKVRKNQKLTQVEVDKIFEEARIKALEKAAQQRIIAENRAFDHFLKTGVVIPFDYEQKKWNIK